MNGVVWPILVGLFPGVAIATFVVCRFPEAHHLQPTGTSTAKTLPTSLLKRPSLDGARHSH
jgi:hypothetical protein